MAPSLLPSTRSSLSLRCMLMTPPSTSQVQPFQWPGCIVGNVGTSVELKRWDLWFLIDLFLFYFLFSTVSASKEWNARPVDCFSKPGPLFTQHFLFTKLTQKELCCRFMISLIHRCCSSRASTSAEGISSQVIRRTSESKLLHISNNLKQSDLALHSSRCDTSTWIRPPWCGVPKRKKKKVKQMRWSTGFKWSLMVEAWNARTLMRIAGLQRRRWQHWSH